MGRAIDLFVTYRFIKLLTTPFEKTEAYKLGIIDKNGARIKIEGTDKPTIINTMKEKNSYTILHKLVFNIKKIFSKVPGLRTKLGTYAAALFLLKDTFKEDVDPKMWEQEGDEVQVFEPTAPTDTVLGVEIFPVIHIPTQSKIFVSAEDIKEVGIEDLEL